VKNSGKLRGKRGGMLIQRTRAMQQRDEYAIIPIRRYFPKLEISVFRRLQRSKSCSTAIVATSRCTNSRYLLKTILTLYSCPPGRDIRSWTSLSHNMLRLFFRNRIFMLAHASRVIPRCRDKRVPHIPPVY